MNSLERRTATKNKKTTRTMEIYISPDDGNHIEKRSKLIIKQRGHYHAGHLCMDAAR